MVTYTRSSQQDQSAFRQKTLTRFSRSQRETDTETEIQRDRERDRKEEKRKEVGCEEEGLSWQHCRGVRSGYDHDTLFTFVKE